MGWYLTGRPRESKLKREEARVDKRKWVFSKVLTREGHKRLVDGEWLRIGGPGDWGSAGVQRGAVLVYCCPLVHRVGARYLLRRREHCISGEHRRSTAHPPSSHRITLLYSILTVFFLNFPKMQQQQQQHSTVIVARTIINHCADE